MNRNEPTTDTYRSTRKEIAAFILASPLAGSLRLNDRAELLATVATGAATRWSFLSVQFDRAGTEVTLTIGSTPEDTRSGFVQDAAGNDYLRYELSVPALNWPCHGSTDAAVCAARLKFYEEVTHLALDIQATFDRTGLWRLERTPAQRQEEDDRNALSEATSIVKRFAMTVAQGMRVGSTRYAPCLVADSEKAARFTQDSPHRFAAAGKDYSAWTEQGDAPGVTVTRVS